MIIVNYEVYVLEQSRGWMLHARFPRQEREAAISEAKELEQTLNIRVKVVRETYYTDDNLFEEAEVYITGGKPAGGADRSRVAPTPPPPRPSPPRPSPPRPSSSRPAPRAGASRGSAPRTSSPPAERLPPPDLDLDPTPPRNPERSRQTAKARQLLGRLLAITALALAAAFLSIKATPNVIMFLWDMGFRIDVSPQGYGQLLFTVFVLTFLTVAVPLALRFLPRQTEIPILRRPNIHWQANRPPMDKKLRKSLNKLADQAMMESVLTGEGVEKAPKEVADDDDDLPPIMPEDDPLLPEITPDPDDLLREMEERRRAEEEKARAAAALAVSEEPAPVPDPVAAPDSEPSPGMVTAESQGPTVNRFLNGAVNAVKSAVPVLDSYNKFALHLYMAGGVESLCEFRKIDDAGKVKLTVSALETLGTKADLARKFHEKLPEYLLEPRYLGVVQAGRDAMGEYLLAGDASAHGKIKDVMREWNKPADKKTSIVTVMFTDMVGSTDLTQAVGDAAAQEIVRRHNSIVRGALAQFGGKEIKHTGDGIMASFASAASAVEATVNIQRQVIGNNRRAPEAELHLRIGLNAGEPIEEEDDLFGTTVQLAARVCAATNTDQILCTAVVKDLSFGKTSGFVPVGERRLKGFRDPVTLFEVVWQE